MNLIRDVSIASHSLTAAPNNGFSNSLGDWNLRVRPDLQARHLAGSEVLRFQGRDSEAKAGSFWARVAAEQAGRSVCKQEGHSW